ncbi:MAG: SNF2-related protein [Fibrobacter sp.]|nr:SNF2-related protein [Fibrobacter sp.]
MEYGVYGGTWWSKKWLDTLLAGVSSHDVEVALKYVARGQVTSLDVMDNRVRSEVKGPNGGSHDNYIVFPKFPKEQADIFVGLLKQQPADLVAISHDSINPSIEILLEKSGLALFDEAHRVNMNCDCRDALPCKYVISTFLKMAEKIAADPLVLFKIHGLDLTFLKDYKPENVETDVPMERALVHVFPGFREETPRVPMFRFEDWRDYSHVLPAMLTNFPDFCPGGNFKKSFVDELERCRSFYNHFETFEQFAQDFGIYHARTFLMEKERLQVIHAKGWSWTFDQLVEDRVVASGLAVENIMGALCRLNQSCVWHNHVTVRYLHQLLTVAYYLVRCGAIYPQVFWVNSFTAQVRWLPAEMLPDVLNVVMELEKFVPDDFAFDEKMVAKEGAEDDSGNPPEKVPVRKELAQAAEHILSIFIGRLLRFSRTAQSSKKSVHDNLLGFFFDCKSGRLAAGGLKIPSKIQKWFSVYNSLDFNNQIVFVCGEVGKAVGLEVFVEEDGETKVRSPLANLFAANDPRLLALMNVLNCVAETFKPMKVYLENRGSETLILEGAELKEFVTYGIKKFEVFGIKTELPKSLLNIAKPKAQMRLKGSLGIGAFKASDLLDFDWEVALGDETVSAQEFLKLAKNAGGLLKMKSQYVEYSEDDLKLLEQRLQDKKASGKAGAAGVDTSGEGTAEGSENGSSEDSEEESSQTIFSTARLLQAALTGRCDEVPITMTDGLKAQLDEWRADTSLTLPEGLNASLRPYQERGYAWMHKNLEMGFGCILADDMGLGKTLQVITFLLKIKQEGKITPRGWFDEQGIPGPGSVLVVVPAGLLCNWKMEVARFAPELSVYTYHGPGRKLDKFQHHILLTTYSTYRLDHKKLRDMRWQVVIIDEAQNIKNADSEQSRLLRAQQAPMKIAMSGTPVENRLLEFWTIMDFCNRGFLPGQAEFRDKYETPIQKFNNQAVAERFKNITAPFMLRRMKTDKTIISDLPDKIQQDEYAELTKSQAALYKHTLDDFMAQLAAMNGESVISMDDSTADVLEMAEVPAGGSLFKRKGLILQMIMALKQICNHPRTFLKVGEGKVEDSGKLRMLLDLLASIQEQGEKTLIFTQFREMGDLLQEVIQREMGLQVDFYHGGCSQTQRNAMVKNFQENPDSKVLILSLKAAGTGLNLTAASQVIHYDLWWNPAIEAQATDRAFRIGQTRNVQVHRFITKGTFEEKINALLESKKAIAQMTVNAGETWLADMDDKQLDEIFRLDG